MKSILASIFILAALTGCDGLPNQSDQCLRQQLFQQCMAALPKGPERIHNSNDWSEVVDSCEDAAREQSWRKTELIKLECRGY